MELQTEKFFAGAHSQAQQDKCRSKRQEQPPNVLHELGSACTQMKRYFAGFVSVFHDVATAMHFRSEMTSAADHD